MKKTVLALTCALGAVLSAPVAMAYEPIDIETLAARPDITGLNLSSDGKYFAALIAPAKGKKDRRQLLAVWDATDLTKPPKVAKPDGESEFLYIRALKAGKLMVYARKPWEGNISYCGEGKQNGLTKTFIRKTFITDTKFSKFAEPFGADKSNKIGLKSGSKNQINKLCSALYDSSSIIDDLPSDAENVIIAQRSGRQTKYIKYNLATNKSDVMLKSSGDKRFGIIDGRTGTLLTKSESDGADGEYDFKTYILDVTPSYATTTGSSGSTSEKDEIIVNGKLKKKKKGTFSLHEKLTTNTQTRHSVDIVGYNKDFTKYYISTNQFSDKTRIYEYNPITKSYASTPLYANEEFNVTNLVQSEAKHDYGKILGYSINDASGSTVWINPKLASLKSKFQKSFPGKNIGISDWDSTRSNFLVTVSSGGLAPSSYLVNSQGKANFLGNERAWTKKAGLSDTKLIYYTARDGMKIPGLLTLPMGWKKGDKPAPTVIHPHGGPWARDFAGWDGSGWIPFFTSRGFAVLQPQYRGSDGWGHKLWMAGDAQWGLAMQDDKDDGAAYLVQQGIADKDKMVIMGYSYGGFAAFAATVRPNSPYKCAIAGAGVSELDKIGNTWGQNRLQRLYQGKTVKGMDPIQNIDKANIPILIFHGDRDQRVPVYHSKNFYKKVKSKVPAKLVMVKDQKHQLPWSPENQRTSLIAMDEFIKNECGIDYTKG